MKLTWNAKKQKYNLELSAREFGTIKAALIISDTSTGDLDIHTLNIELQETNKGE